MSMSLAAPRNLRCAEGLHCKDYQQPPRRSCKHLHLRQVPQPTKQPGNGRVTAAAAVQGAAGEGVSRSSRRRKPHWVRLLEEDADIDEDVARVLDGADGDPDKIRDNMESAMADKKLFATRQGVEKPPRVAFREVNPFALWVWVEFHAAPSGSDIEVLDSVLRSWFVVGKLGGFNTQNLQVYNSAEDDQSFFEYANGDAEDNLSSFLHDVSQAEVRSNWARVRVDMGTCDELAVDVLLNMLFGYSRDHAGLRRIFVGGTNSEWPTPEEEDALEAGERGEYPKVGINPMRLPEGVDEELMLLDELMEEQRRSEEQGRKPEMYLTERQQQGEDQQVQRQQQSPASTSGRGAWGHGWAATAAAEASARGGATAAAVARATRGVSASFRTADPKVAGKLPDPSLEARIAGLDDEIEALFGDGDEGVDGGRDAVVGSGRSPRGSRKVKMDEFRKSFEGKQKQ